jgi:hypothetical protein
MTIILAVDDAESNFPLFMRVSEKVVIGLVTGFAGYRAEIRLSAFHQISN